MVQCGVSTINAGRGGLSAEFPGGVEPMKFLTLADWTGLVETELFAATYKSYGLATVRYAVFDLAFGVAEFALDAAHVFRFKVAKSAPVCIVCHGLPREQFFNGGPE